MDDLISRQEAIDAILPVTGNSSVRELYEHVQEHGLSDMWSGGVNAAIDIIIALPSVQPEKRTEERTKTHSCDCISRQDAIDVCDNAIDLWHGQLGEGIVIAVKKKIEELLLAQPEIEERTEEFAQNVPKEDLISRKAAIEERGERPMVWADDDKDARGGRKQ